MKIQEIIWFILPYEKSNGSLFHSQDDAQVSDSENETIINKPEIVRIKK